MWLRIVFDIVLVVAIMLAPWWLVVGTVLVLLFYFNQFYEAVFVGLGMDLLYGAPTALFGGFQFVFTVLFLLLFAGVAYSKTKLRVYA